MRLSVFNAVFGKSKSKTTPEPEFKAKPPLRGPNLTKFRIVPLVNGGCELQYWGWEAYRSLRTAGWVKWKRFYAIYVDERRVTYCEGSYYDTEREAEEIAAACHKRETEAWEMELKEQAFKAANPPREIPPFKYINQGE